MGKRVLADKKIKLTILTTKPANEADPTVAELNAGIEACKKVLSDGFRFSPTASGTASAKALCGSNEEAFTDSNAELAFTLCATTSKPAESTPPTTSSSRRS